MKETEIQEDVQEISENGEYEYIEQSKPLGRLVFMVAFTAIMLVSSTYAWFSAQKNVTIGGLTGTVNVAEGLEISLDAKHWSQEIDFSKYSDQNDLKKMYGIKADGTVTGHTYDDNNLDSDDVEHNIIPTELLPVSTTGTSGNGIGLTDMNMYRGIVNETNAITSLSEVITVMKNTTGYTAYNPGSSTTVVRAQDHDYPGYYAIDLFLRNSTSSTESGTANYSEILQLNNDSFLQLTNSSALTTGLQNTVRVAFALYEADGSVATDYDEDGTVTSQEWTRYIGTAGVNETNYMTASQSQILNAYYGKNIHDVAIWEPNASDHVQYIVNNYMSLPEFSLVDTKLYINPSATEGAKGLTSTTQAMRTYALTTAADTANTVTKIYDWATPSTGLAGQITLQTEKTSPTNYVIADGVKNLVSVTSPATAVYTTGAESGVVNFKIQDGAVAKIRMYVWLEGQDVDCINYASHGGGIHLDVGLLKDATVGDVALGTTTSGTYLPTGFTEVAAATATSGLTIADSSGNEYVWVEVPTSLYDNASYNTYTTTGDKKPASETDYDNIEYCLKKYTSTYSISSYTDEHPTDTVETNTGLTSTEYTQLKQKMLSSIYKNGGFYVGKYETGIVDSYRSYEFTQESDFLIERPITEIAVVQANAYPYNWVRCSQAQELASGMESGEYTSSLMFGVQWDLVMKYLETSNAATVSELSSDSTEWGNYANNEYTITNENAEYATVDLNTMAISDYAATLPYNKASGEVTLLTTGADSSFGKMGIYDLAGNMFEWTLEYTSDSSNPCALRGGSCDSGFGDVYPASDRSGGDATYSNPDVGFRPSIF